MASAPSKKPTAFQATAGVPFNPTIQVGPDVSGEADGYVFGSSANFYLSVGQGDPNATYAWTSTQGGSNWIPIPNNKQVTVQAAPNAIQWLYNAPSGVSFKLLIGVQQ